MMSKPILLGRRKTTEGREGQYEQALREPKEIVIADDMNSYQLFEDTVFATPQDSGLEGMHASSSKARSW